MSELPEDWRFVGKIEQLSDGSWFAAVTNSPESSNDDVWPEYESEYGDGPTPEAAKADAIAKALRSERDFEAQLSRHASRHRK